MDEPRKILEFSVTYNEFPEFIKKNRGMFISEIVAAAEELLYCNLDTVTVCRIGIKKPSEKVTLDCKLRLVDIIRDMDDLLGWTVQEEEYELSHRIKLLDDYIKSNNITAPNDNYGDYDNLYKIVE